MVRPRYEVQCPVSICTSAHMLKIVWWLGQRDGMGLLEYQAMFSLRDVAHGGVLCTLVLDQPKTAVVCSVRTGGMGRPSRTKSHPTELHTSSQPQPGVPPCWTSPLAFGLIGLGCILRRILGCNRNKSLESFPTCFLLPTVTSTNEFFSPSP